MTLGAYALIGGTSLLAGCAMREVPVDVGQTHLRSVAIANYERAGGGRLERLLDLLASDPMPADRTVVEPGLTLDLALMTEVEDDDGRRVLAAVDDGDSLLDGFGRRGRGDGIKLRIQTNAECTVYVILVDASGRPSTLFPNTLWSTVGNPVLPGRPYRLPQGNVLFELGPTRGIETLYVVASREPWPELEALLAETESATWELLATPAVVERASRVRRGVEAVSPSTAHAVGGPAGTLTDVPSKRYLGKSGARVVVTRWFQHR